MTASDERREVAKRLRKCGAELSLLDADCETAVHVIDKVIGCREEDSWERFLGRLADLIDPTCKVVPFDEESMRLPHCSVCMQPILKPWPNFCPNCGARVVEGGE